jgi:hypothetical protein
MNVEDLFMGEIQFILDNTNASDLETNEYKARVDCATKLADRMIELKKLTLDEKNKAADRELATRKFEFEKESKTKDREVEKEKLEFEKKRLELDTKKVDLEHEDKTKDRDADTSFKTKQLEDDNKDKIIRNGIAIAGIVIPVLVTIWGTKKSFEFEKEGTITTIMGRGFINKLLPKK